MIGVIVGLKTEAQALRDATAGREDIAIAVAAASPARAQALAQAMAARGARLLVSSGMAGALDPDLRPGDVVSAARVVAADARYEAAHHLLDTAALLRRFPASYGSDVAIASTADKRRLAERYLAFVDMESHGVARAAAAAGLPWLVLRAIADDAETSLPAWAIESMTADGGIDPSVAALAIARKPTRLLMALRLARANSKALLALRGTIGPMLLRLASQPAAC